MTTIILANNRRDAARLADLLGMRSRDYRFPYQASSIEGMRPRRVIVHPSFEARRDRHAINAMVKRVSTKTAGTKVTKISDRLLQRLEALLLESESTRAAMSVLAEPLRLEEEANSLVQVEG